MKLSEAIRLGAMIRPQSHYAMFCDGRSCAQGAAAEALGVQYADTCEAATLAAIAVENAYSWGLSPVPLPCGCEGKRTLLGSFGAIAHLNDISGNHQWTRERIADWVATIEPQEVCQ